MSACVCLSGCVLDWMGKCVLFAFTHTHSNNNNINKIDIDTSKTCTFHRQVQPLISFLHSNTLFCLQCPLLANATIKALSSTTVHYIFRFERLYPGYLSQWNVIRANWKLRPTLPAVIRSILETMAAISPWLFGIFALIGCKCSRNPTQSRRHFHLKRARIFAYEFISGRDSRQMDRTWVRGTKKARARRKKRWIVIAKAPSAHIINWTDPGNSISVPVEFVPVFLAAFGRSASRHEGDGDKSSIAKTKSACKRINKCQYNYRQRDMTVARTREKVKKTHTGGILN